MKRRQSRPPNIVFLFADDLGWKDVGYQGARYIETPRIDRLAREGMVFTDAYAAAGNCAPSRACLLSGAYTPRHGVYAVGSTDRGPRPKMRLRPVPNRSGLAKSVVTLPEALRAAGYATGIFGKWHLDGPDGASPAEQGFDTVFDPRGDDPNRLRDDPEDPKSIFSLTRAATAFIDRCPKDRPFFAYVSHHAIHSQIESRPASRARFRDKARKAGDVSANYAACTFDLDAGVGMLLDHLRATGRENETLVVFSSDNGATQQSSQEPLRGSKGGYYEGGIREPFVVRWPGHTRPGTRSSVPVCLTDLYPSFLDAAGAPPPGGTTLDGESLRPVWEGRGGLRRTSLFWHFPGYLDTPVIRGRDPVFRTRPVSVIRRGDWKLLLYHEEWVLDGGRVGVPGNRAVELYNLKSDVGERRDRSQSDPKQRDALLDELLDWLRRTGAPLPREPNPAFDPKSGSVARLPGEAL